MLFIILLAKIVQTSEKHKRSINFLWLTSIFLYLFCKCKKNILNLHGFL